MKTRYILTLALGAMMAFACNKAEIDAVEDIQGGETEDLYEIKAEIVNTKTAYDELGHFSWVENEKVSVVCYNDGSDPSKADVNHNTYTNNTGAGTTATFAGGAFSSPWVEEGLALYPSIYSNNGANTHLTETGGTHGNIQVTKKQEITPDLDHPLAAIPLIGRKNSSGIYQFKTAVGILKVTISDIPSDAQYLYLIDESNTFPFSGKFAIGDRSEIRAEDAVSPSGNDFKTTINFTPAVAGETRTFYIPVPTGTIPVGTKLKLDKGSSGGYANIMTKTFTSSVTVAANHVIPIKAVSAQWNNVGAGLFMDDNGFYNTGFYSRGNGDADYVSVTIQQKTSDPSQYRIVNPYQAYLSQKNQTAAAVADPVGPDAYFYFTLQDGYVSFENYNTGMYYEFPWSSTEKGEFYLVDPNAYGYNKWNNCVIKYDVDGTTPLNVQLAPFYFYNGGSSYTLCHENPKIEIVFPGSSRMLTCDNYPNKVSASRSSSKSYTFTWTAPERATISGIEAAVASTENDAVAAIRNGDASVKSTSSSGTTLTFDNILADGTYYLVYKIATSGQGWTFKSTSFYYGLGDASDVVGSYIGATKLVIAAADDKVGYNVKITHFLDHEFASPLYGIYQDGTITISASDWSATPLYNDGEKDHYMGVTGSSTTTAASPYSDIVITVPNAGRVTASGYRIGVGTISGSTFTLDGGQYYTNLAANRL